MDVIFEMVVPVSSRNIVNMVCVLWPVRVSVVSHSVPPIGIFGAIECGECAQSMPRMADVARGGACLPIAWRSKYLEVPLKITCETNYDWDAVLTIQRLAAHMVPMSVSGSQQGAPMGCKRPQVRNRSREKSRRPRTAVGDGWQPEERR